MTGFFAVRNMDEATRKFISRYASEHNLSMAAAIREISLLARERMREAGRKKHASIFSAYGRIRFSSGKAHLSRDIDRILYGKRG